MNHVEELEKAWESAWSMRADTDLSGMIFIGSITRNNREYQFWRDLKGGYWYDSKPAGREKPEWQQRVEKQIRNKHHGHHS